MPERFFANTAQTCGTIRREPELARTGAPPLEHGRTGDAHGAGGLGVDPSQDGGRSEGYSLQARDSIGARVAPEHVSRALPDDAQRFGAGSQAAAKQHGSNGFGASVLWTPSFRNPDGWGNGASYWSTIRFPDLNQDGRADDVSGREAYMRYVAEMGPLVEARGGRFLFSGDVKAIVIGEVDELWEAVGIAEYPSRADFYRIATSAEVQKIGVHREAGLAGQLLIMTIGQVFPPMK